MDIFNEVFETKFFDFKKNVNINKKQEIDVLIVADAIGSAPASRIGFIIIKPIAWHKAAKIPKIIPINKDPSIFSHL